MTDYLKKYQDGGQMSAPAQEAPAGAPAEGGAPADPMALIVQAAMQAVQSNDSALAMQVCQMIAQVAGGGGAPQEQAPAFKKGGKIKMGKKKPAMMYGK